MADDSHSASRRGVLAATLTALATVPTGALPPPQPLRWVDVTWSATLPPLDSGGADVLRLCAEFHSADAKVTELDANAPTPEDVLVAADNALLDATEAVMDLRPATMAELRAIAQVNLAVLARYTDDGRDLDPHEMFSRRLTEELLRLTAAREAA